MTITAEYTDTSGGALSTLHGAQLTKYRACHWLCDVLRNFFSNPINIMDERLADLMGLRAGAEYDDICKLVRVGTAYLRDDAFAGHTPLVLIGAGESRYPVGTIGNGILAPALPIGRTAAAVVRKNKSVGLSVMVITESYDGTMLLSDELEGFLVRYGHMTPMDGMISQLVVSGTSGIEQVAEGAMANAKQLYQCSIGLTVLGQVAWQEDTTGPVFRGVSVGGAQIVAPDA